MKNNQIVLAGSVQLDLPAGVYSGESIAHINKLIQKFTDDGGEVHRVTSDEDKVSLLIKRPKRFVMHFNVEEKKYTYTTDYDTYKKIKQLLKTDGDVEIKINGRIRNFRMYHYSHMEEQKDERVTVEMALTEEEQKKRRERRDKAYGMLKDRLNIDISNNPTIE